MKRILRIQAWALLLLLMACGSDDDSPSSNIDDGTEPRQAMRNFVQGISAYAKNIDSDFIVIPQNGQELATDNGEPNGTPQSSYLAAIDAVGREDLFYGYDNDNEATPENEKNHLLGLCKVCEKAGVEVLVTDYCSTPAKMDNSYQLNNQNGFISFAAPERDLNLIPEYPADPYGVNVNNITKISQAKNFLYIINSENFNTKNDFIKAVAATNYDAIIMDLYHNESTFSAAEIQQLKKKQNGGQRLVISYMSIGEAEDYRYYWQTEWKVGSPDWIENENPDWEGNYKVKYWQPEWQSVIYGNDNSYLKKIIDTGFDGVYLDIIDAFEYFE
ncbi:endo alpha-1,4 polygalactosaminidase [Fulvivirga sediminis]|uniref:Endo alpha-1,4 polygalactosaminidase n=1 Tax=Fulvivirga sediminis TaxID=2803949 RepID=A0A937F5N5_9BACT|nr:endo alpha-1,4 polygalactosaminidase [Fulvivirga sediminis]MBL3655471.1 endo alpha-1,4 polygalactosaminidase [Fulvivirga sediminis]